SNGSITRVPTHFTAERASEVFPTIHTGRRAKVRSLVPWGVAAAFFALAGLALWLRRTPSDSLSISRTRHKAATPVPAPTAAPTPVPPPDLSIAFLGETHASWPYPPATTAHAVSRHGLELRIVPGTARVFLDGKYVGIADDWNGQGSGSI